MIHLFYYQNDNLLRWSEVCDYTRQNLGSNDLFIFSENRLDGSLYSEHLKLQYYEKDGKKILISNVIRSGNIDYEQLSSLKLDNIYVYDFRDNQVTRDHVVENLIRIKSTNCEIIGISQIQTITKNKTLETPEKNLRDIFIKIKEYQQAGAGNNEIYILLKLEHYFDNQTIDTLMNHYIVQSENLFIKTISTLDDISKYKNTRTNIKI